MMSGRDALAGSAMWLWADEGEQWLRAQFGDKLEFHTAVDVDKREVTLKVYQKARIENYDSAGTVKMDNVGPDKLVFEVTEKVEFFVSQLTATKLILIAG